GTLLGSVEYTGWRPPLPGGECVDAFRAGMKGKETRATSDWPAADRGRPKLRIVALFRAFLQTYSGAKRSVGTTSLGGHRLGDALHAARFAQSAWFRTLQDHSCGHFAVMAIFWRSH